jgi:hypothetical protein
MPSNFAFAQPQGHQEKLEATQKNKVKQRLRFEIELTGTPQKALAASTCTDVATISKMLDEKYRESPYAHMIPGITREMGPGFMEWLAMQCGGIYLHGAEPLAYPGTLRDLIGTLAHQSGSTIQELVRDLKDSGWEAEARCAAIPGLRTLRNVIDTLIFTAERGDS